MRGMTSSASCHNPAALQGWQGVQTIPRVVTYDAGLDELVFYPVVEVEQLREETLYDGTVTLDQVSYMHICVHLAAGRGTMLQHICNIVCN